MYAVRGRARERVGSPLSSRGVASPLLVVLLLVAGVLLAGCLDRPVNPAPPVARFDVLRLGESSYAFDARDSNGGGARITNFTWDMGDGTRLFGPTAQHTYRFTNGVYKVTLTVKNRFGLTGAEAHFVTAGSGENEPPRAAFTASLWRAGVGQTIVLDSSQSHDPDGDPIGYHWSLFWPITDDDYRRFREERGGTMPPAHEHPELLGEEEGDGHADDGHDHDTHPHRAPGATPSPLPSPPDAPAPMRPAHGSEKGSSRDALYPAKLATLEDHVFLRYPMEGLFYVRLEVRDVKGDTDEEIWPILIEANPPARFVRTAWSGELLLGTGGQHRATPDPPRGGSLDQNNTTVVYEYPVVQLAANLTYDRETERDLPPGPRELAENRLGLALYRDGERLASVEDQGAGTVLVDLGAYPPGAFTAEVFATRGATVPYAVVVEAQLDTNPFTPQGFRKATL